MAPIGLAAIATVSESIAVPKPIVDKAALIILATYKAAAPTACNMVIFKPKYNKVSFINNGVKIIIEAIITFLYLSHSLYNR